MCLENVRVAGETTIKIIDPRLANATLCRMEAQCCVIKLKFKDSKNDDRL